MVTNRNLDGVIRTLKRLIRQWEEPIVGHYRADPFRTLISCLLSLRTKDETTRGASQRLFRLARSPQRMIHLSPRTIERAIYPVGFYRTKARTVRSVC
ncbi:MAG: endonuclease III, partial [Candidatus Omnitrophota bacterium]|nr:endonuclease III [Candidatus Omnitrophota bacterium]